MCCRWLVCRFLIVVLKLFILAWVWVFVMVTCCLLPDYLLFWVDACLIRFCLWFSLVFWCCCFLWLMLLGVCLFGCDIICWTFGCLGILNVGVLYFAFVLVVLVIVLLVCWMCIVIIVGYYGSVVSCSRLLALLFGFNCVSGSVVCIFVLVSGWLWFVVFCVGLCFVTLCSPLCVVYLFCIVAGLA